MIDTENPRGILGFNPRRDLEPKEQATANLAIALERWARGGRPGPDAALGTEDANWYVHKPIDSALFGRPNLR